jgi:hypothetical protein
VTTTRLRLAAALATALVVAGACDSDVSPADTTTDDTILVDTMFDPQVSNPPNPDAAGAGAGTAGDDPEPLP